MTLNNELRTSIKAFTMQKNKEERKSFPSREEEVKESSFGGGREHGQPKEEQARVGTCREMTEKGLGAGSPCQVYVALSETKMSKSSQRGLVRGIVGVPSISRWMKLNPFPVE